MEAAKVALQDLAWLSRRDPLGNKGTFGKILVVAGSSGMCGAAYFASLAALRTGAGMVKIQTCQENRTALHVLVPEAMLELTLSQAAWEAALDWCDILLAGPGLGTDGQALDRLCFFLEGRKHRQLPTVLDADALNLLSANPDLWANLDQTCVLTPHMGEMSRLTGLPVPALKEDPGGAARNLAGKTGAVCVLKDAQTYIADAQGRLFRNTTGNAGMATAGSGDVLSGILAGILAQKNQAPPKSSLAWLSACAVFLHGSCGDLAQAWCGQNGMTARDLLKALPVWWSSKKA